MVDVVPHAIGKIAGIATMATAAQIVLMTYVTAANAFMATAGRFGAIFATVTEDGGIACRLMIGVKRTLWMVVKTLCVVNWNGFRFETTEASSTQA